MRKKERTLLEKSIRKEGERKIEGENSSARVLLLLRKMIRFDG